MEKEKENQVVLDHAFCSQFKKEIEGEKMREVLYGLLSSTSSKVPLKKAYLARACKNQKSFRKRVDDTIEALCRTYSKQKVALRALRLEITGES